MRLTLIEMKFFRRTARLKHWLTTKGMRTFWKSWN